MKRLTVEEIIEKQGKINAPFKKIVKKFVQADLEYKDARDRRNEASKPLTEYVKENGVPNRPGTEQKILIVDGWKVQHTCKQGKTRVDEEARLAWCQEHHPEAILIKPVVSEEMWTALKAIDAVPAEVLAAVEESGVTYSPKVWLAGDAACPKCDAKVHTDHTFCNRCGLRLRFDKKRNKKPKTKKAKPKAKPKAKSKRKVARRRKKAA